MKFGWSNGLAVATPLAAFSTAAESTSTPASGTETVELAMHAIPKWTFVLPNERWIKVGDAIPIAHARGTGFAVESRGLQSIALDTDGDGRAETEIGGVKGFATLRAKDKEGNPFTYPIRLAFDGRGWSYAAGGALRCGVANFAVQVIDQNGNGRYDDYGVDAMIVGNGECASFLSDVVSANGSLFTFDIDASGRTAKVAPYTGDVGTLDARSGFRSFGKLEAAVIKSDKRSFNVADVSGGMKVPAGEYQLVAGYAAKGAENVRIAPGRMPKIVVPANEKVALSWGAPVAAEFDWSRAGENVTVQPNVKFYGSSGEEYHSFRPDAKSPKIVVTDKKTRKELASGRFGGC